MKWLSLTGIIDWIDADLLAWIDTKRKQSGEVKRERKLGTVELLWLMLAVSLDTGKNGLHEILRLATADLGINWHVSAAGFCKARKRFSPPAFALPSWSADLGTVPPAGPEPLPVERPHRQGR